MHLDGEEENVVIKKMTVGGANMYLVVSGTAAGMCMVRASVQNCNIITVRTYIVMRACVPFSTPPTPDSTHP